MSAFIERLAKRGYETAIARCDDDTREWMQRQGLNWATEGAVCRDDWREYVRAILSEMRELSPADVNACPMEPTPRDLEYWRAMIETALKEGQ